MATVTSIAAALASTLLAGLTEVDTASTSSFYPALNTASVGLVVSPFGQETTYSAQTFGGSALAVHRIPLEFWVRHTQGDEAATMQRARDVATQAVAVLLANDGAGYELARDVGIEERVDQTVTQVANAPWVVVALIVPVENEVI